VFPCSVILSSSVSIYCLVNSCTHSTQRYDKKIQVKFKFGHCPMIFDRVMPLDGIFSFPTVVHIQLKFEIWNAKVKFEFGHGSMIFSRVMPHLLWKKKEIFSFHSLSPQQLYTFNSNLTIDHFSTTIRSIWRAVLLAPASASASRFQIKVLVQ
jgi:hypothetical protein